MPTTLRVRVTPRSSRGQVTAWDGSTLHMRVTAPPADGLANAAVKELVAATFKVPKSSVTLKSGGSSREKLLVLQSLDELEVRERLRNLGFVTMPHD